MAETQDFFECPVCAFSYMDEAPRDHAICACCGTHFGYQDIARTYREIRNSWLMRGGLWFDEQDPHRPRGPWSAWSQLDSAGLPYDVPSADAGQDALVELPRGWMVEKGARASR